MRLHFNTNGNEKQKEVCRIWNDNTTTDIVYGGSKGSGKSYLGCNLIFGDALTYPGIHCFIARESLTLLRKFTIPSIHEVFQHWNLSDKYYSYNGQDNYFKLYNKSIVYLLDAKWMPSDPLFVRFGSMQMTRGWIEEAGEFSIEAKNNLAASIGRWKNDTYKLTPKLLQTCNPKKNYLYSDYYKPHKLGTLPEFRKFIQALPSDNKMLPDGYIENLHKILSKNERERLLFGNWEYDDDPATLCEYDAIVDCFTNDHVQPTERFYISADLAMKGRDRFVAGLWNGMICNLKIDDAKSSGKEIEEKLKQLMIDGYCGHSQTVVDSDGMGSYLESYLVGIKEFHGGASAFDSNEYANLKSECAYKLAELVNKRQIKIICNDEQKQRIIEELEVLKADDIDADEKKKRIIKKDVMKEHLGRSPDYLDMLIMRMYFEAKPQLQKIF